MGTDLAGCIALEIVFGPTSNFGKTVPDTLTTRLEGFASARLPDTHLLRVMPGTFHPTLATTSLYRSSSGWFETCS
jgi:hypothetical protein